MDGHPEHGQRQHGVEGRQPRRVILSAGQHHLDREDHDEGDRHEDRLAVARADDRGDEDQDRGGVQHPADALVRVEAVGTEDADPGEEELDDHSGRDDEGDPVVGERESVPHVAGP